MPLPHDSSGFLTGERLVSSIDAVKEDTAQILAIIKRQRAMSNAADANAQNTLDAIALNTRPTREVDPHADEGTTANKTIARQAQEGGSRRRATAPGATPNQTQARDENGRFVGGNKDSDSKALGWLSKMVDAVRGRFGPSSPDTDNLDPTLTAIHEASQLMAPIAKVGGLMFGAGRWLFGKKKKDDIPKDQKRHNKLIEKLLSKIARLRGGGDGLGGPMLGGFIGGLVERFGPILTAAIPKLVGMLFKGLGLALAWQGGNAIGTWIYKAFQPQIDAVAKAIGDTVKDAIAVYDKAVGTFSGWIEKIADFLHLNEPKTPLQERNDPVSKDKYNDIMQEEYAKLGYSPLQMASLKGQLHTESGFNPDAIGPKGHFGMGQAGDAVAKKYNIIRGHTAEAVRSQVAGEAMYMKDLLAQFGGDWDKARAAYNWGPGNMQKAITKYGDDWRLHIPAETSDYLRKIKVYSSKYTSDFSAASPIRVKAIAPAMKTISMPKPKSPAYPAGMGVLKIPPAPKIQQQVGGQNAAIPVFIQGGVSDISQNVSDRNLAHLITGGLGMDYRGQ